MNELENLKFNKFIMKKSLGFKEFCKVVNYILSSNIRIRSIL